MRPRNSHNADVNDHYYRSLSYLDANDCIFLCVIYAQYSERQSMISNVFGVSEEDDQQQNEEQPCSNRTHVRVFE